ncbi:MAG: NusA N-terminal domain-containing protein, partial [Lysobacterales bacterium]
MSKEILLVVDAVSNEKGVSKDVIFEALEAALASAAKKLSIEESDVRVAIDRQTGEYETFRRWEVLDDDVEMEFEEAQLFLHDARATNPEIEVGAYIEEPMVNAEFGRIAAQTAKQVIVQRVREAERALVVEAYKDRAGEMVNGIVKRIERGNVYLDLGGNAEVFISRRHMIQGETVRPGERLRAYLYEVKAEQRGPQLFASRTAVE